MMSGMEIGKKIFVVRDVSRVLIAFGIFILVLNFNQYLLVYIFGFFSLIMGFLNLFSLNWRIKFLGALNMAIIAVYLILSTILIYPKIFGWLGTLIIVALGAVLLVLSLRFIFYLYENREITF